MSKTITVKKVGRKPYAMHQFWTKEDLKMVVRMWDDNTLVQIAEKLGREKSSIQQIATVMRKNGIKIARKRKNGYLALLINEVKEELA